MRYLLILALLILSCNNSLPEKDSEQIYNDCYKVSENMFKNIPESEFKTLNVDDLCDEDTAFYEGKLEKACERACKDAFFKYK